MRASSFTTYKIELYLKIALICLGLKCYSCGEEGHIAGKCTKVHYYVESKQKTITDHISKDSEFRKNYKRERRQKFSVRENLETLTNDAIRLRSTHQNIEAILIKTIDAEFYNNFFDDEFNEVLHEKIYVPFYQKYGFPTNEGPPPMGSIESVENLTGMSQKQTTLSLHPPALQQPQLFATQSRESLQPLVSGDHLHSQHLYSGHNNPQNSLYVRQSTGGFGMDIYNPSGSRAGITMQNSVQQRAEFAKLKIDMVKNFETYYPHGNITIISEKYNILMNERVVARAIERTTGKKVNKNILKGIDIFSRGSIYGGIKKSNDSLLSIKSSISKNRNESELHSMLKGGSLISSQPGWSTLHANSGDANQIESQRRTLGINQSSSAKRTSSVFLNPEKAQ